MLAVRRDRLAHDEVISRKHMKVADFLAGEPELLDVRSHCGHENRLLHFPVF